MNISGQKYLKSNDQEFSKLVKYNKPHTKIQWNIKQNKLITVRPIIAKQMASKYKEKILKINQRTKVCYIFIYYDTVIKMIVEIPTVTMKSRKKSQVYL